MNNNLKENTAGINTLIDKEYEEMQTYLNHCKNSALAKIDSELVDKFRRITGVELNADSFNLILYLIPRFDEQNKLYFTYDVRPEIELEEIPSTNDFTLVYSKEAWKQGDEALIKDIAKCWTLDLKDMLNNKRSQLIADLVRILTD